MATTTMVFHILAGSLSLVAGFVALYAAKGAPLHRKAGMFFVVVMLTMTTTGVVIAATRGAAPELNIPAALMTAYLVITALTAIRPPATGAKWLTLGLMLLALSVAVFDLTLGIEAAGNGGRRQGIPAFPYFLFGIIGLIAVVGDLRMLRSGPPTGAPRIARHLWRMSFALFIAAMSFFFGQADVIPEWLRIRPLLAVPPFAVLFTMLYWLWRVRFRRSLRGLAVLRAVDGGYRAQ
jgi:uncharacterized membrane protein